jgi:hypothetical protein
MSSADWQRNEQRHERREKRHIGLIVLLIVLLVGSNAAWLAYESQFETLETTTEEYEINQDSENGNNNSIINGGEIVNGETNDKIQEDDDQNP